MLKKLKVEKELVLLLLIYLVAELLVWPLGNFPLNDDWAYAKTVQNFNAAGHFNTGLWPAMTLWTHTMYGSLFTGLFGFSFNVLRVSTLLSSLIGSLVLYQLIKKVSGSKIFAFAGTALYVFHPVYFSCSNSYMTEVNFSTLFILGISLAVHYFQSGRHILILPFFVVSVLLTLLRQYGLILPLAFAGTVLITRRNWKMILSALCTFIFTYLIFKGFESYLRQTLAAGSAYQFSGALSPFKSVFYERIIKSLKTNFTSMLLHLLFFLAPLAAIRIPSLVRLLRPLQTLSILAVALFIPYYFFRQVFFPAGNVFVNMSVGAMTFYENLVTEPKPGTHSWSELFGRMILLLKFVLPAISFFGILLTATLRFKERRFFKPEPLVTFTWLLLLGYFMMLLVTESYFDRYHIPLYALGLILISVNRFKTPVEERGHFTFFAVFVYLIISVAGTRDYFAINRIRWEAVNYVRTDLHVPREKLHGGFEQKAWSKTEEYTTLYDFNVLTGNDYLIQYSAEPGFSKIRSYPFRRYFPPSNDTIFIFKRDQVLTPAP